MLPKFCHCRLSWPLGRPCQNLRARLPLDAYGPDRRVTIRAATLQALQCGHYPPARILKKGVTSFRRKSMVHTARPNSFSEPKRTKLRHSLNHLWALRSPGGDILMFPATPQGPAGQVQINPWQIKAISIRASSSWSVSTGQTPKFLILQL